MIIFQTNVVEKMRTQFFVQYLFSENRVIFGVEIMVEQDRLRMPIKYDHALCMLDN